MKYFVIILQTLNLSQALFNNGHKYMPMGYKEKPKCPDIPAKKPSSSFEVFQFLSSMAIATNIAANIVNNVNSNNNNNNNNDNQDNQNTLNFNNAMNENSNMNMNMLAMAMGRSFGGNLNSTWLTNYICEKLKKIEHSATPDYDILSRKVLNVFGGYALLHYLSLSCHF